MLNRRTFLTAAVTGATATAFATLPAFAQKPFVHTKNGIAIGGYDPVAYFTDAKPVKGSAAHSAQHDGATWHFASAENAAMFKGDPARYAPQFGGYCAYAVSKGATAPTDPAAWTVYEGKLYLNYDLSVRDIWSRDIPGNLAKANANWPGVLN